MKKKKKDIEYFFPMEKTMSMKNKQKLTYFFSTKQISQQKYRPPLNQK
jgi:hypothetical protein